MGVEQVRHTLAYVKRMQEMKEKMILGGVEFDRDTQILSGNGVDLFKSTLNDFGFHEGITDMATVIYHTAKGFELFADPIFIDATLDVIRSLKHGLEFISSHQPENRLARESLEAWDKVAERLLNK